MRVGDTYVIAALRDKLQQRILVKLNAIFGILIIFTLAFVIGLRHTPR